MTVPLLHVVSVERRIEIDFVGDDTRKVEKEHGAQIVVWRNETQLLESRMAVRVFVFEQSVQSHVCLHGPMAAVHVIHSHLADQCPSVCFPYDTFIRKDNLYGPRLTFGQSGVKESKQKGIEHH